MKIEPFKLERYFAQYEFAARYLLSSSDSQALRLNEVLDLADAETRQLWQDLTLAYTESAGHPLLRREIAGLYQTLSDDQTLVCAPQEGIFLALNSLLEKGDHVICTYPAYQSLYEIASSLGAQVTRWQPEESHGWRFNPAFLEKAGRPETRLLIINFPHNPTGYLPDRTDFGRILDFARERDWYILSDEMYRWLEYHPAERLPSACEIYNKAITLGGMSKAFGLPGARIGWLAAPDRRLLNRMAILKDYTTICNNAPGEILALMALRAKDRILTRQLARIERNLALLEAFFTRQADLFEWNRPRAGTIAFPRLKAGAGAAAFCRKVIDEAGIMLLPSTVYDFDDAHFRVGFGREDWPEALTRFEEYIRGSTWDV
jgi:aspartate/methionine/tyrosine aminotransferase